MSDPWFYRRSEELGSGYGVRSWQGLAAGVALGVVIALTVIVPLLFHAGAWTVYGIAASIAVIAVFAFLRLAEAKSD